MMKKPSILNTRIVAESRLFSIEEVDLSFQNGTQCTYERLSSKGRGSVVIVALRDEDTFFLIREYGVGVENYFLGLPKGIIEQNEDPCLAANRELKEEIGYGAKRLQVLKKFSISPGYMPDKMFLVLAQDLYPSELPGDEPEPIERIPWQWSSMDQLVMSKECPCVRTIASLYFVQRFLQTHR